MMLYDRTAELFPDGKEALLRDFDTGLTWDEALQFLLSENTYVKRKVDGSVYVGHLSHRPREDETLRILTEGRPAFGFSEEQMHDYIRSPNVMVEYRSGAGTVSIRRGTLSDVPEIRGYIEKYTSPE